MTNTQAKRTGAIAAAFTLGWYSQHMGSACYTPREVLAQNPTYTWDEATAYLNGVDDAMRGDRFRLDYKAQG